MKVDWPKIILNSNSPSEVWNGLFRQLLEICQTTLSPTALHDQTVIPDRILSEAAWDLWLAYPGNAERTSERVKSWTSGLNSGGRAVLILDALSLREMPLLLAEAKARGIPVAVAKVTGAECPTNTDQFARALGASSRSALQNDGKPGTFAPFSGQVHTDVLSTPFEDCSAPPAPNLFLWHTWLDDQIHLYNRLPDQVADIAAKVLRGDGFWGFLDKLRQGRKVLITSDHGYAVSRLFSSEVSDANAVTALRETFGASRSKPGEEAWSKKFMPPLVMTHNRHHVVMGQWKWKVQGGFPHICHGGMSLLEVAVPWIEIEAR